MPHRFFVPASLINAGGPIALPDDLAHQVRKVLRLHPGDTITLLDNAGGSWDATLTAVGAVVLAEPGPRQAVPRIPVPEIALYQAPLKRDNFEWALQKCTEVGVSSFSPTLSQHSVARPAHDPKKLARWQAITREAAEQSGRTAIPVVHPPLDFAAAVQAARAWADLTLIAWVGETAVTMPQALAALSAPPARVALFIGPEGGYSPSEVTLAREHGAVSVTLGPYTLRAETAAVVAAAILVHHLGTHHD